jgi:hypothetical protein
MLLVEHRLKSITSCQAVVAQVAGPPPATHLFLCSGFLDVEAAHVVQQSGLVNMLPQDPLPLAFLLPDNHRQFLSLSASDGTALTMLAATASASFPCIDLSQNTTPVRREITAVQVQQQGGHVLLVILLKVSSSNSQVALAYQASLLAGPVAR